MGWGSMRGCRVSGSCTCIIWDYPGWFVWVSSEDVLALDLTGMVLGMDD